MLTYQNLCQEITRLGQAAAVRLQKHRVLRSKAGNILEWQAANREVIDMILRVGTAWDQARAQTPEGSVAQLAYLLPDAEAKILLALATAPALSNEVKQAYRSLTDGTDLRVEELLELASPQPHQRLKLLEMFDQQRMLTYLLNNDCPDPITTQSSIKVASSVVAALQGMSPLPPEKADVVNVTDTKLAKALVMGLGLWDLRPMLTILCGGSLVVQHSLAEILAAAGGWHLWLLPIHKVQSWIELVRDAALAKAVIAVAINDVPQLQIQEINSAAMKTRYPVIGLSGPPRRTSPDKLPRIDIPISFDPNRVRGVHHILSASTAPSEGLRQLLEALQKSPI